MSTLPAAFEERRPEVDRALEEALDRLMPRIVAIHPFVETIAGHLRTFMIGGKRIRPLLLLLGYEAAGGDDRADVMGPALALELLHTSALVHDDVIDRAATRRGRPTVHHAVADEHAAARWLGPSLPYGEAVAILIGDIAFAQADEVFLDAQVPDGALVDGFRRFTTLREEVMVGQYLDLRTATSGATDRDLALTVATLKSGRYSVSRPLEIGAALAGAPSSLLDGLRAVGDPLGRAFQVRDDLLGVFGDEQDTGKSASSDLIEGKRTLLIAEAFARLGPSEVGELDAGLGDPDLDEARAARLRDLLETSGARRATEAYVHDAVAEARAALGTLDITTAGRDALLEVADYLGDRSA